MLVGGGYRAEGNKGEKKWDNCNTIISKIYFKKEGRVEVGRGGKMGTFGRYKIDRARLRIE